MPLSRKNRPPSPIPTIANGRNKISVISGAADNADALRDSS